MDYTQGLNPMQKQAVLHTEGPLLIIAGAGSGKTRVLTHRMAHVAAHCADAFNVLAITFTNKAAREMKERVHALMPRGAHDMWVSTFHSCCVRILRREIQNIGFDNTFTIYDTDDSTKLMKGIIKAMNLNEKQYPAKSVLGRIGRLKDDLIGPADFADMARGNYREGIIAEIYYNYQKQLASNNALDFDDLILKTLDLFMHRPEVLNRYASRFRYVMVDEYQDTNTAQYQFVRLLANTHGNLCVVGDDDQSIYGWRGANIRNILDFEKDFDAAAVIKLEQNYRSTGKILEAANAVIANNKGRKGKNLWTNADPGDNINYVRVESDFREADVIVNHIKQCISAGHSHKDFAVLYRMNSQSRVIEDKLVQNNVRYRIYGGVRFYERREVKDVLAYLRAILNPRDDISLKRIINVPRRGIGSVAVTHFEQVAVDNDIKFYDALFTTEGNSKYKRVTEFVELLKALQDFANVSSVSELIKQVLTKTGYYNSIEVEDELEGTDRAGNVMELVNKAAEFEQRYEGDSGPTLAAFLEEVALVADIDDHSDNEDTVSLMTLHSSKGLEFNHVFIPGFEEGIFPTYRAMTSDDPSDLEEERRLCYVGITRAKKRLFITSARRRKHNGQDVSNVPSRFLDEIPGKLVQKH